MTETIDAKTLRERAKKLALERRASKKQMVRQCVVCHTHEGNDFELTAHPEGLGPSCKDPSSCMHNPKATTRRM